MIRIEVLVVMPTPASGALHQYNIVRLMPFTNTMLSISVSFLSQWPMMLQPVSGSLTDKMHPSHCDNHQFIGNSMATAMPSPQECSDWCCQQNCRCIQDQLSQSNAQQTLARPQSQQ